MPGASIETVEIDGAKSRMGANDQPNGPWSDLVEHLRTLLGTLAEHPTAAVALEVEEDGSGARLTHHGKESLRLDLSKLTVRAVLWEGGRNAGDWHGPTEHSGDMAKIEATPGWTLDLPFDHGHEITGKGEVVAYVTFTAFDGEQPVPVSLQSPRRSSS